MKSWKKPTPDQLAKAAALLGRLEHRRHFFDKLQNPRWLRPLWKNGFFRKPPPAVHDKADGTVSFPPWPESRYLVRMAELEEARDDVLEIALAIPHTENVPVHEDLAEIALQLPPRMAATIAAGASSWFRSPYELLLPEKLGRLIDRLAEGGELAAALELTREVLQVVRDPNEADLRRGEVRLPPDARSRFNSWDYEQIVEKRLKALVAAAGTRALDLLCDLLGEAVRYSLLREDTEGPEDYSYVWRPAVEDDSRHHLSGIKNCLVTAVRNAAEQLARQDPELVVSMVTSLERHRWRIFHRIALHVLTLSSAEAQDLITQRLTDRTMFDELGIRHEYCRLSSAKFSTLAASGQQTILGWIETGPDLEEFKEGFKVTTGRQPTEEETAGRKMCWQRDRLAPIAHSLSGKWRDKFDHLVKEIGPPEHPDFPVYVIGAWRGPTSPKTSDDLRAMSLEELSAFLAAWQPSGETREHSREGLGVALEALTSSDPGRIAEKAQLFIGQDPTYVRSLFSGWREAAKKGQEFPWEHVFVLAEWVVRQPIDIPARQGGPLEQDPDWGWTRKALADLIGVGFGPGQAEIPPELRTTAWAVLRPLTDDPDPTPDHEERYCGSNMDPATLCINTTRGSAMHAVVQYALWLRRDWESSPASKNLLEGGFAELPEVREILEAHLDPQRDPSLAVRSAFGQWLPWLVLLDPAWVAATVETTFPSASESHELWHAAWDTYVVFCDPYDNVLELLNDQYMRAIEKLREPAWDQPHLRNPQERLAEHLMAFYARGKLPLDDDAGLLARFFVEADERLRAHAIESIGRNLQATRGAVPEAIADRLRARAETIFTFMSAE